jgi:hypothetical protein
LPNERVNPSGPVFISYRWSDGSGHALDAARRLRASGVPVWLDRDDMPPGETNTRLAEALASGLSGAVLVATEDIQPKKTSDAIHEIELPTLLNLNVDPRFTLAVVATVPRVDDLQRADRTRTPELYGRSETEALTHYSSLDSSLDSMGADFAKQRLRQLRAARSEALTIDIQTRRASTAFASDADLVFRTVPPVESRAPSRAVWEDLQRFLTWLPTVLADHGPPEVRLGGGAHLSVAFAFGAALPEAAGIPLSVRTTEGGVWRPTADRLNWRERLPLIGSAPSVRRPWSGDGSALAVFVDLVPSRGVPSFVPYLEANRSDFAKGVVVDLNRRFGAGEGPRLVSEVSGLVRREAALHEGAVHLFLRAPWSAAALLGASLNTLQVTLYEWENTISPPTYIKTVTVASGVGGGPVTTIHLP